jgi:UV DNA damage endonuclease
MLPRLGLCCLFRKEPIRFRTTTARALRGLTRKQRLAKLSDICLANMESLLAAVQTVYRLGIGAFRISSGLLPRATHPKVGYKITDLPDAIQIQRLAQDIRVFCQRHGIRLSLHPDQFITLSSHRPEVTASSIRELEGQARLAELLDAGVINIHGGGAVGGKRAALKRFQRAFKKLSPRVRQRLCVENDDRVYTPSDLLPL